MNKATTKILEGGDIRQSLFEGSKSFNGYTLKMLKDLGADENKPIIVICGGVQLTLKHAYVIGEEPSEKESEEEEFGKNSSGTLIIDLDV